MKTNKLKSNEAPVAVTTEASNQTQTLTKGTDMNNSNTVSTCSNVQQSTPPVIAGYEITVDEYGRFNLNAIHRASGYGKEKTPSYWLRSKQAKELIEELKSQTTDLWFEPIHSSRGGDHSGTFAIDLLAVSYAGWISPKFQLQVNQVFLDYRMGKLTQNDLANALPSPLTPAHQLGIQKEIGVRVYEKVKDESKRPRAFKAIYRYLKNRFDVGSYKDIPDRDYTQALAAVHSAPLEGEWLKSTTPRLEIHYPVSEWRQQNPQFEQFQHNLPSNQLRINHHMLLREDAPIQSSSPTVALLNQLQDEGHNVDACVAEVNGLFMAAANMDTFLKGVKHGIKSILCESSTITYSR